MDRVPDKKLDSRTSTLLLDAGTKPLAEFPERFLAKSAGARPGAGGAWVSTDDIGMCTWLSVFIVMVMWCPSLLLFTASQQS